MKVPILTTTRTTPQATPQQYSRQQANPDAFGAGIATQLQKLGAALTVEKQKKEKFDVTREYIAETTALQQDMFERQQNAPLGAEGFTESIMMDYDERHKGITDNLRKRGFSEEAISEMDTRLAGLRDSVLGQSIKFQAGSYQTKVLSEFEEVGTNLTQIAGMNPDDMQGALDELNKAVDEIPNIDAETRAQMKSKNASAIRIAAAQGLARLEPDLVVNALTGGATATNYRDAIASIESAGSGGYSAVGPTHPKMGRALGRYQIMEANIGPWSEKYLGRRVTTEEFMKNPAIQDALFDGQFGSYVAKYGEEKAAQAWFGGAGSIGKLERSDSLGTSVGDYGGKFLAALGKRTLPKDGKTGNAVLDSLTAQERMQVLGQAQTAINQRQTSMKAPLQVQLDNAQSAYMNTGEYAGPTPSKEQFIAAFGAVEGQQKYGELVSAQQAGAFVKGMSTATEAQIQAQLAAMRPTDTSSPTYAVEQKQYEAARTAADRVIKMRTDDPANYVMNQFPNVRETMGNMESGEQRTAAYAAMDAAYDQLGILKENRMPLTSLAAQQAVSAYNNSRPEDKLAMITSWRGEMGNLYGQGLKQLAKEGLPVPAYLSGLLQESPAHSGVAANVLRGMDMIEHDKSLKPNYSETNKVFRDTMGDAQRALNPIASGAMVDAATALYVFRGGSSEVIDSDLMQGAIRDVLGGSAENTDTGILDMRTGTFFNNITEHTILPVGTTGTQFSKWKDGLVADDLIELSATGKYPQYKNGQDATAEDIVNEGVFIKVAPNEYIVKMDSDAGALVTDDGGYYRMRITPEEVNNEGKVTVGPVTIGGGQ